MTDQNPIFRPIPRRAFELTPASTDSSAPPTPALDTTDPSYLDAKLNGNPAPSRTRSILNLTSSTLFGIYARSPYEVSREENSTPWGTGAQTPTLRPIIDDTRPAIGARIQRPQLMRQPSHLHPGHQHMFLRLILRTILLFTSGVAYGVIITHLHDDQRIAPVQVAGIKRYSWTYLIFWGIAGVGLGSLLPWVDFLWEETLATGDGVGVVKSIIKGSSSTDTSGDEDERPSSRVGSGVGADWNPVVRSIGAFIGIAFAIVRSRTQFCFYIDLLTFHSLAETAMAVYPPSIPYPCTGQSCAVVLNRSLKARLSLLDCSRSYRHCSFTWRQSWNGASACYTIAESEYCERIEPHWTGKHNHKRNHRRGNLDCKCAFL